MFRATAFVGFAAAMASFPTAAETTARETMTVWEIDHSGRPPFERRRVEVPVADVASLESAGGVQETVRAWVVDYSGRPPFRRSMEEVPVIDAASLEVENAADRQQIPAPFHKRRHR
jgi:hypothetical protein